MTAVELVQTLRAKGVEFQAAGGRLRFRPGGVVTAEEREALRRHKAEVLRLLSPDPAEVTRALGLPLAQLDRVLTVRVPWLDTPLYFVPGETDAEALVVAEGVSRGAVWTRRELLDLMAVPGITRDQARTVALAKLEMDGEVVEVRPATAPTDRAGSDWPAALLGLGPKTVGPLGRCGCGAGSWVRYRATVVCLACARRRFAAEPVP